MKIITKNIAEIKPNEYNPNEMDTEKFNSLKENINNNYNDILILTKKDGKETVNNG